MPDHENLWALLADVYTPVLILFSIKIIRTQLSAGIMLVSILRPLIYSILICYTVMLLDMLFGLWPVVGLDYSTHTAIALVFIVHIGCQHLTYLPWLALSLAGYAWLMKYLNYHSYLDVITTVMALAPALWWVWRDTIKRGNKC